MTHDQRHHDGFPQDEADENPSPRRLSRRTTKPRRKKRFRPQNRRCLTPNPIPRETALAPLPPLDPAYSRTIVSQLGKTIPYREDESFKTDVDEAIADVQAHES